MVFRALSKGKRTHEQLVFCSDSTTGLKAVVSIHSTVLGPAIGGCRMFPYQTEEQALEDVLRLSEAMSYKAAMAGLQAGGGKSVIIGDPEKHKTKELLRAFGRHIESLNGRYIVAKDMGINAEDLQCMGQESSYVLGRPLEEGGVGDPSRWTAKGVHYGIREAVQYKLKRNSLKGIRVLVQGLGAVGRHLTEFLLEDGAELFAFDIKKNVMEQLKLQFSKLNLISEEEVYNTPCEVFAPCSVGSVINEESIAQLKCPIIAGGANNQLSSPLMGKKLMDKGVLYIPDFVINSGGLIYVCSHFPPQKTSLWIEDKIKEIAMTIRTICERSSAERTDTAQMARNLAKEKIKSF